MSPQIEAGRLQQPKLVPNDDTCQRHVVSLQLHIKSEGLWRVYRNPCIFYGNVLGWLCTYVCIRKNECWWILLLIQALICLAVGMRSVTTKKIKDVSMQHLRVLGSSNTWIFCPYLLPPSNGCHHPSSTALLRAREGLVGVPRQPPSSPPAVLVAWPACLPKTPSKSIRVG